MIKTKNVLIVDMDGTLCQRKAEGKTYSDVEPNLEFITKLRAYSAEGWRIAVYSSRGMRTYNGNIGEIYKHVFPEMQRWLETHQIPYDELMLGKPWPGENGFYIDDRSVRPKEFLNLSLEELYQICAKDALLEKAKK